MVSFVALWTAGSHQASGSQGAHREEAEDSTAEEATAEEDRHEEEDEPGAAVAAKVGRDLAAEVKEEEHHDALSATASATRPATQGAQETGNEETTAETTSGRGRHLDKQDLPETGRWESALQRCLLPSSRCCAL